MAEPSKIQIGCLVLGEFSFSVFVILSDNSDGNVVNDRFERR